MKIQTDSGPESTKASWLQRAIWQFKQAMQVVTFAFAALIVLMIVLAVTGKQVRPLAYVAAGTSILALVIHLPLLFWRLPGRARVLAYIFLLGSTVFAFEEAGNIRAEFERTPEGQKLVKARAIEEQNAARERASEEKAANAEAAEKAQTDRQEADAAAALKALEDYQAKAERCFSWGHQLPALSDAVKNSLHNPHSFEHVETVLVVPDADHNNVVMTFRAENGFGALRLGKVKAQLVADGCEVQNIGEPEVD